MFKKIQRIHFVGIGGSGMSGIAEVLINLGYKVSGSDLKETEVTERLKSLGASIFIGHKAASVEGSHVVVTSTAVDLKNPEVVAAKAHNIPVIPRIEMLAEIARLKYTIAIAGTHGKTTTTSMVAAVLQAGGLDPTVIVGGRLKHLNSGARMGQGDYLVAEADESDGSFLKLSPALGVITNMDNDHLDYYHTFEKICEAFVTFSNRIPFYGCMIVCLDDPHVRTQLPKMLRRVVTYGTDAAAKVRARNITVDTGGTSFEVTENGTSLGHIRLSVPGKHNVLNALAAVIVGQELGIPFSQIAQGLGSFEGVGRRMEMKGEVNGITVIDDYGHHPTEIRATLSALRERYPKRRLVAVFQPHRFSRTQSLFKEFSESFKDADRVFLMDIYPAGEKPIKGVTSELILKPLKKNHSGAQAFPAASTPEQLREQLAPGDVVLTLGAGDVLEMGRTAASDTCPFMSTPLAAELEAACKSVKLNEPLFKHTSLAIGGPADYYADVSTREELIALRKVVATQPMDVFFIGAGSNLLVSDKGIRGLVIHLQGGFRQAVFDGPLVKAGAGAWLPTLSKQCAERGLSGIESLIGVPGTIGGGVVMNAGTREGVLGDVVESIETLDEDARVQSLAKFELGFGYRSSRLIGNWILSATLRLKAAERSFIMARIDELLQYRTRTQPVGTSNCGSVFKNPEGFAAAQLVEKAGLKGMRSGGAQISERHANFIVNTKQATAQDVKNLMQQMQDQVFEKFGVRLEPEIKLVGEW